MLLYNKVIRKNNTVLTDISPRMSNIFSDSHDFDIVAAEDALYLGSELPFNHKYFQIINPNSEASAINVQVWNGNSFEDVVSIYDGTSEDGASFGKSGIISWEIDRNNTWGWESTTENIPDLQDFKIYDMYWVKLTWNNDFTVEDLMAVPDPILTPSVNYVGQKFSTDQELGGYYPDLVLANTIAAFKTGKTNWDEQSILAAEEIVLELRKRKTVWSRSQIIDYTVLTASSVHKTAEIIFRAFGDDYSDNREAAKQEYRSALSNIDFGIDRDQDSRLDTSERVHNVGLMRR